MNTRLALTPALGLLLALAACGEDATTDASEGTSPLCQEARGDDGSVTLTCADSEADVQAGADGVVRLLSSSEKVYSMRTFLFGQSISPRTCSMTSWKCRSLPSIELGLLVGGIGVFMSFCVGLRCTRISPYFSPR